MEKFLKDTKREKLAFLIAAVALVFSSIAANSNCLSLYHQPDRPEGLKAMRKF